ncbi:MAG: Xaa-Pro peptidase family protein [Nanoarchaeota archaeon]
MKTLQEELIKMGFDCAIFMTNEKTNPNLFYFTKYKGAGFLVIPSEGKALLHVPSRDLSEAKIVNGVVVSSGRKLSESLLEFKINSKKVGIDFVNTSVTDFNMLKKRFDCEFFDISVFMDELRAVKDKDEIKKMREACKITDKILNQFVDNFSKFKTEEEVAAFLVYETRKLGCVESFEPIVASGKNGAVPHHTPSGKLQNGFLVVDFGVKYLGYCSDITRTFYFGKPSIEEEKIYYDLLKEQERAISLVKPGKIIGDLCIEAEKNLRQKLIHSLGHGLGIEVHEFPYVSTNSKTKLSEGMTITIEPGEYIDGKYGIRIEDDLLVTKNGCEVLTKFSKKLICL